MTKITELKQTVDFLEKKHGDFEEKLDKTLALQQKMDKDFAVHQQYTKTTLEQILEQTRKTNGRVNENTNNIGTLTTSVSEVKKEANDALQLAGGAAEDVQTLNNWKSKLSGVWLAVAIIGTIFGTVIGFAISILVK